MTYKHTEKVQITEHFNSAEFRCKCGKEHDFAVNPELVEKLEKLFRALNCSKIIVTSGYRCAEHDKAVGGSSTGQHTKGNAADIRCYGQDGQIISSKTVCCKAQDIGFTGIANITSNYQSTHVDVRTGSKWYGDEVKGNHSVTTDFYQYFENSEQQTSTFGIDVSKHNGSIDWQKVRNDGVQFAILRAGYGKEISQIDKCFDKNYQNATAVKMPIGAYWYSYATTVSDAKKEAEICISALKNKQFAFPIYFDLEEKSAFNTGIENCSEMVKAFCSELESAGYWAGLYMSRSPLQTHIAEEVKSRYALWVAEYANKLNYINPVGIWQKSCKGSVNGISSNVDLNICYVDYPAKIQKAGLNGFSKATETPIQSEKTAIIEKEKKHVSIKIDDKTYSGTLTRE